MPIPPVTTSISEDAVYSKVAWRIIPWLFVCYIAAYLDRVKLSFAKLQMQSDVPQISDTVFGTGAGIFFLGYFVFEVPSNILMEKVGARLWIARIMITWGIVSTAMIFVNSLWVFYGLRLLLGFAEAGFFPGVILYLTYWFPSRRRGEMVALFMLAIALTGVVGAPLSGWILHEFSGSAGLKGWQILFLLEGIPSIVLGIFVPWLLANGVRSAHWLNADEKQLLEQNLQAEEGHKERLALAEVFLNRRLIFLLESALDLICNDLFLFGDGIIRHWLLDSATD